MLIKLGVDISRLKRPIRRKLGEIDTIIRTMSGNEAVITSTYEGTHLPESLHYADLAVDIDLPERNVNAIIQHLQEQLGNDFDVVYEINHIHIEYDVD